MGQLRRLLLTALPKFALSKTTGWLTRRRIPTGWREGLYRRFAARYGANLAEVDGELTEFRCLDEFFQRGLRAGSRAIAESPLVHANDGRIVTAGPITDGRIQQVKGRDYSVAELLMDEDLAAAVAEGSQSTIYLAPGDYHRVHAPFAGVVESIRSIRGTLFPVNPGAVGSIDRLFVRNARVVFTLRAIDGRRGALVMVGALNVGAIHQSVRVGQQLRAGDEVGRFGFGSTTVSLIAPGTHSFVTLPPEHRVWMGGDATSPPTQ